MQTTELREYCKRRGWNLVHEYSDQGVSGAKESRPELNRLIADAHKRRFDAVVVWRFDRFARSVSHLLRAFERSSDRSESSSFRCPKRLIRLLRPGKWFSQS
jgi:DNA invertase Pin-like site-specific DNA recombinase